MVLDQRCSWPFFRSKVRGHVAFSRQNGLICKSSRMLRMECRLCPIYNCAHRYSPGATLLTSTTLLLCLVISYNHQHSASVP